MNGYVQEQAAQVQTFGTGLPPVLLALMALAGFTAGVAAQWLRSRPRPARRPVDPAEEPRSQEMYAVGAARHGIYIRQFAADGLAPENLVSYAVPQEGTPGQQPVPEPLLPLTTRELNRRIEAMRAKLERTPGAWNAETVALRQVEVSRTGSYELPVLKLGYARSDYATFRTVADAWAEHSGSARPTPGDLQDVLPGLSNSFGINLTVVTADGELLLTTRSVKTATAADLRHISVNEGMSVADEDPETGIPDPYRTALRGIEEELGADLGADGRRYITFHSLVCDVARYEWALLGHVDLTGTEWTSAAFRHARMLGVAPDYWETSNIEFIPFNAEAVQEALQDDSNWVGHGYVNLLLSALHRMPGHRSTLLSTAHAALAAPELRAA